MHCMHRIVCKIKLALPLVIEHRKHIQERGFSCSRRPHHRDKLSLANRQIYPAQHPGFGVACLITAFDVLKFNHDV